MSTDTGNLDKHTLQALFQKMVRIRRFEEAAGRMMEDNRLPGGLHLCVGQEAVAAGIMQHLSNEDQITSTHRGHGHLIAKGGEFKPMFAELLGRSTGYCRGRGGSMHISCMDLGMLGANGIVGAGQPIAVGAAFANKFLNRENAVTVTFFGDGASNEGGVHEAMNLAALYELPCVFVCENNGYAEYTSQANSMTIANVADRAPGYGMPGVVVDGMDVMAVYEAAGEAIEWARQGNGPTLLECKTYRYYDHVGMRGIGKSYRTADEVEQWKKRDAIESFEKHLVELNVMTQEQIERVYLEVNHQIEAAIEYALESPMPHEKDLLHDVYAPVGAQGGAKIPHREPRKITYVSAINEALRHVLTEQGTSYLAGEDVTSGGVFGFTRGLLKQFGQDRIYDTPISEKALLGLGIGSSASGCRPILDLMFMDFLGVCMDEVANQLAKMRYMFGGTTTLPVTVLTMAGGGGNFAAQHSQSLEAWLAHLPGLKVAYPSDAYDAKGMIIAAARDDNPVFVIMDKLSLAYSMDVPEDSYEIPLGKAAIKRVGSDLTIVAISRMVHEAMKAAEQLSAFGLDVEVIDSRSISPFDTDTIVKSVRKTHRALVVHEAVMFGGFGAEITAQIQAEAFDYLDAPVMRVGAPFCPVPFSPALEQAYMPNAQKIVATVRETLGL